MRVDRGCSERRASAACEVPAAAGVADSGSVRDIAHHTARVGSGGPEPTGVELSFESREEAFSHIVGPAPPGCSGVACVSHRTGDACCGGKLCDVLSGDWVPLSGLGRIRLNSDAGSQHRAIRYTQRFEEGAAVALDGAGATRVTKQWPRC